MFFICCSIVMNIICLFRTLIVAIVHLESIGFTLIYSKMDVMPLVPETKMADVSILISLGKLLARRTTWLMPKTTFTTSISSRVFGANIWQEFSINTLIFQHSPSFHIFTYKANTISPVWLPERTLSLSQFQLTESTHSSSFLHLTSTTDHYENVYYTQPFSSLLYFVGETFSSLEHRNFVKPQKRTNSRNT